MIFVFLLIALGLFLVVIFNIPHIIFLRRTKKRLEASLAAHKKETLPSDKSDTFPKTGKD